ncbi:histone deacetylase family protein [Ancylostoma duodenale]|uniref:histone deacetylase n=1 Tax=Ancylostoma duodenale TaxID=51022 RepID=A0A0C2DB63_9BILA|nr:histone deacetylase family protein [Ancylostoma duodenale]
MGAADGMHVVSIAANGEVFKQKQMDLMAHFERAQQALNMQHLQQYYQTLQQHAQQQAANSAAQAGPERMDEGLCDAAVQVAPLALASSMGSLLGSSQSPTTSREAPAPQRARSEHRNASTNSTSQTISQHTKDRLKNMIAQRNREGSQTNLAGTPPQQHAPMSPQVNVSSPHFEPYRVPASLHTAQAVSSQPSSEYQLRKVNSEPNLKMRIRAKLLSKGSSPVQNQSTFNFTHPQLKRSDSETSGNGAAAGNLAMDALLTNAAATAFPPHLIMPSPSLPNLAAPNLAQAPQLPIDLASLMAAAQLTPFLSLPSLFKTHIGLGGGLLEEDVADRAKLAPGVAALGTLSQQLPVFGNPSLLKQQLRELVLRRKSLVREEPEDDDSLCTQPVLSPGQLPTSLGLGDMSGGKATGLAYDSSMARHECVCGESSSHVEHGGRVQSIWARLLERGLVQKCERIAAKKASLEQLRMVHSPTYVTFFAVSPTACLKMEASQLPLKSFVQLPCGGIGIDSDTYFNDATTQTAARVAAGSLIELASQVAENRLRNGFACIRPPGHHSEKDQAMGFCFFNNVAITARYLQNKYPQQCARIAIIDWDVHHGNGTQLCFEEDPSVLYLSLHRHDNGNFFPGTGAVTEVGRGAGKGFSVNVPFSGGVMRDADYLAAWRVIVQPVLEQFQPTFILVSAGFDACCGHPNALGGYKISAEMFGFMTRQLMSFAGGRVVLALEGGYDLASISDAAEQCVKVLCGDDDKAGVLKNEALEGIPCLSAQETIQKVIAIHKGYWPALTAEQGLSISELHWQTVGRQFQNLTMGTVS